MELKARLKNLATHDKHPFHMPGHKGKFPSLIGKFDATELPGLDNLHNPEGVLARIQDRVADIYQAGKTYFLVNGSSVGLMSAMVAALKPGDLVLVQRSSHKAVLAGLIHSGAMPVWIEQTYCPLRRHWLPPEPEQIKDLLAVYPVRAAIFTNPDYYGLVPDICALTRMCHAAKVMVLVDEAHGAHLAFGGELGLPVSAIEAGADIVVQSPHKTLPALTQAAWMHLNNLELAEGMQQTLNIFHTTSPSYLLLASLEFAGNYAAAYGKGLLRRLVQPVKLLELKSRQLNLAVWPRSGKDWTKLVLPNRQGLTKLLRDRGIFPELVQGRNVLFMLTMADALDYSGIAALAQILPEIGQLPEFDKADETSTPPLPEQACSPREAWIHKGERVHITNALGRISRHVIAPYPPGTMIVAPGQRLGKEQVEYLQMLHAGKVVPEWIEVI